MAWNLKEKEVEALLAADGKRRYEYFVRRVCETRKVWTLYADGWASFSDGEKTLVPLWPHETYAARFGKGDWSSFAPTSITLRVFLDHWIPGMKKDRVEPAIFPVDSGSAVSVSPADLESHLRIELFEVYGEEG